MIIQLLSLTLLVTLAWADNQKHPHELKDWAHSTWFDGMVKIPLVVDNTLWVADLYSYDPSDDSLENGGYCLIDNNQATTVIFGTGITHVDDWVTMDQLGCSTDKEMVILEDGFLFRGWPCRSKICIGSRVEGLMQDVHTSVCNENQYVYYSNNINGRDWVSFYNNKSMINSICGFGKEAASEDSISFLSYAKHNGVIDSLVYSLEIGPILSQTLSSNSIKMNKGEEHSNNDWKYKFETTTNSTLVIGGYEPSYMVGDPTWFSTEDCVGGWNLTGQSLALDDGTIMDTGEETFVV